MSNSPLLRLCRHNQNRSLYSAIKILLKRNLILIAGTRTNSGTTRSHSSLGNVQTKT